ncbi:hypothetical protein ISF6_5444 [Piscinibacter sakaiensis]|uniref:Uncharacterized protein n=1 Tax=Piscinibacter sakaiensis TaxID=1547922 RepID=A0A0K8NWI1_PISS1|nr:hypothetical protein ISF6_5444 [Piscinibacter sakaiensis]
MLHPAPCLLHPVAPHVGPPLTLAGDGELRVFPSLIIRNIGSIWQNLRLLAGSGRVAAATPARASRMRSTATTGPRATPPLDSPA